MSYNFHLSQAGLNQAIAYLDDLRSEQTRPGQRLETALAGIEPSTLSIENVLETLINTKPPLIFAESAVFGDGRDWTQQELHILGDIGVSANVTVFDDGRHVDPHVHAEPFEATLLFVPGALLRNDRNCDPTDLEEVAPDGSIELESLTMLYERRLLPLLVHANRLAETSGGGVVTLPGIGCGQFAGRFQGQMGEYLKQALCVILERHAHKLPFLRLVYFDPYNECKNETFCFDHLLLRVRPLLRNHPQISQLSRLSSLEEQGDDFGHCRSFSFVAWDHVSWPGNDYYGGSRTTDDGVKAAATDVMRNMTGIAGTYDPLSNRYLPPREYVDWGDVVIRNGLRLNLEGRLLISDP